MEKVGFVVGQSGLDEARRYQVRVPSQTSGYSWRKLHRGALEEPKLNLETWARVT